MPRFPEDPPHNRDVNQTIKMVGRPRRGRRVEYERVGF